MDFGLLHEDDRPWRGIETLNQHRQHLGDTKSDIREVHPVLRSFGSNLDFIFLSLFGDRIDLELLDQPHLLKLQRNDFFEGLVLDAYSRD